MRTKNLYIGNLAFNSTEEQVRALFEPYRPERVSLITTRGWGHVDIDESFAAQAIQDLDGTSLNGHVLVVKEADYEEGGVTRST